MKKSLRIKGLEPRASFETTSRLIVLDRLRRVHREARDYLSTPDPTGLASLRSAIYRLRYPLECFVDCFPRRIFNAALDQITTLQRATEQLLLTERMIDQLRTRQVARLMPHEVDSQDQEASAPASEESTTVATLAPSEVEQDLAELEADRHQRLEAFGGVLKAILESGDLKKLRRELRT